MCVRGADGKDIGVSQLIMVQQLVRWLQACLHLLHGSMATETSRTLLSVRPGPPDCPPPVYLPRHGQLVTWHWHSGTSPQMSPRGHQRGRGRGLALSGYGGEEGKKKTPRRRHQAEPARSTIRCCLADTSGHINHGPTCHSRRAPAQPGTARGRPHDCGARRWAPARPPHRPAAAARGRPGR